MNDMTIRPVDDRVHLIDALRAVALYGVITYNIVAMVGGFIADQLLASATPADLGFVAFDLVLIQGKARACFALLFGVGFGILMDRTERRGGGFTAFYLRRMAVLLGIGLFNLAFLFFGDILILYAVLGMAMLAFRHWDERRLLRTGLALIVLPPLAAGLAEEMLGAPLPNLAGLSPAQVHAIMPATTPIYRGGDYGAYVLANFRYYADTYRTGTASTMVYDLSVLGLFLLGLWIARRDILADIGAWRPLLRRIAWWCLPIGLVLSVVNGSRRLGVETHGALYGLVTASYAGLSVMAFGVAAALCLFLSGPGRPLQKMLAPMGRMALTGYLASNLVGGAVWYGWGLGMMGAWNGAAMNLFALALFAGLCLISAAWMRFFRFGPAEWVWRSLTYGSSQPLLRRA